MEQDETGVARSQHVVHVLPPGDARVAGVLGPQVQRADMTERVCRCSW